MSKKSPKEVKKEMDKFCKEMALMYSDQVGLECFEEDVCLGYYDDLSDDEFKEMMLKRKAYNEEVGIW